MYGNRPMKRSFSPDNDNNNFRGGQFNRGGHGGNQQWHNKRFRGEPQLPQTIEDKIAKLGDTGSRNVDIGSLAKEIGEDLSNSKEREDERIKEITAKICQCIVSFPTRVSTYATLIALIGVKHYNVSCQIINALHASYPVYLETQKWQEALTIIHLLSSLVNCKVIRPSAWLSQFELILEITLEDNIPQARSDYYVYTVLSSLPYVAQELNAESGEQNTFEQILNTVETYLNKRSKDHLNATRVWLSEDSTVQMDYLDSLWVQTKNFRANNWNEIFLHRPYNDKEYKDTMASSFVPVNSKTIQIPAHSASYVYPSPRVVFRIFEDDVVEGHKSIPGSDKIERFCIENHIRNIIDELPTDSRDCARHLSHMYRSEQLPLKHILIETLLGELFTLPKSRHQEILYHALLYELGKIFYPSKNPDDLKFNYDFILNEAVKVLYDNLDTMNVTCFDRFVQWFSFHLNNTEFLYPWQTWADATFKDRDSPKAKFVNQILDRCVRFSFHKKISTLVQASLASLMPPEVGVKYSPIYADSPNAEELAATVKKLIIEKANGPTICETLNIVIDGVELPEGFMQKEEEHSEKLLKIDIFTAVILTIASKSLTHLSSAIGKYKNVFKALTNMKEGQIQLLQTMHSCLATHPQLQVILVDKLLKAELVEAKEVCRWIFSESMKPHLLECYPWELLNNTIHRTFQMIEKLMKDAEKLKTQEPVVKVKQEDDVDMVAEDVNDQAQVKIKDAQSTYDDLILQVFKRFSEILGDHIRKSEVDNLSYMGNWFRWITGRMQQVYYTQYRTTLPRYDELKAVIDTTPYIGASITNLNS